MMQKPSWLSCPLTSGCPAKYSSAMRLRWLFATPLFSNHFQLFLRLSKSDDFILGSAGVATASALVKVSTFESASISFPPNPFLDDGSGLHASGLGVGDTAPALYLFDGVP